MSSPMMSPRRLQLQSTMTGGKQEISDMASVLRHRSVSSSVSAPSMNCSERIRQDYMNRMAADSNILHMDSSMVIAGDLKQTHGRVLRPHSTPATLMWLEENYEVAEGVCIPRSTLYMHYVDFCAKNFMQPVNAASFGKIIRQQFSQLTTRRLGTRGQSRYHYYGIAVRETSPYFQLSFSKKGASSCETRREVVKQVPLYSPRTRAGTVLPDFPRVKDLNLPPTADVEKITTFLMMYRTHCQRVLDTVVRASFDEVQNFLLHFWQGMPPHLVSILETNALVNLVGVCDCILYRTISNVLLPSMLQTLPDSLTKVVRRFVQELDCWLKMAMANMPENLKTVKLHMASRFAQMLRRQMSLNHLAQASRMVVHNSDITSQMLHDWRQVDLEAICRETLYSTEQNYNGTTFELILKLSKDFESLLEEEVPIDSYVEWLESLVNKCVVMPTARGKVSVRRLARQFLLMWSAFGTRVIRDMTLHSAASFGSFHLLRLMFDDYVLFLVETVHTEDQMKDFMKNITNDIAPQFSESLGEYSSIPYSREMENPTYSSTSALPDQYACDTEQDEVSPPAQEVPSSSATQPEYEDSTTAEEDQLTASCTWMPGEYYPSIYQGGNYDSRRSWPSPSVFPRTENKPYNYQQSTQYVIVSQENDRPERESCRSTAATGYDYGTHFASSRQEEAMVPNHEHGTTPSIMYSASGAIYQSYTVVTSPFHSQQHEKDAETYRERAVDKPRVHHHVTVRMDGTVFCDA